MKLTCLILLLILTSSATEAQQFKVDSLDTEVVDSNVVDSLLPDGTIITPCETCPKADTITSDTGRQANWAAGRLEERRQAIAASTINWHPISFSDSLASYFLSSRLDQRSWLDMAWFHDAGDYFRSNPAYFLTDYQATPMRKTVQPFGLSGDRMNVIIGQNSVRPFDHALEPDGLFDFSDFPTALDHEVYLLEGPAGMLFGGERAVASLITKPQKQTTKTPLTRFRVDKGSFGRSYARASFNKDFTSGRKVDMSLGYRTSIAPVFGRGEDAYHYYGNFLFPVGDKYAIEATGRLYDRSSPLYLQPDLAVNKTSRVRLDREAKFTFSRAGKKHQSLSSISLTHLRQASRFSGAYVANYNKTGNGVELARQWSSKGLQWQADLSGDYLTYAVEEGRKYRSSAHTSVKVMKTEQNWNLAATISTDYTNDFSFTPSVALLAKRESEKLMLMTSLGYTERAPTLHELFLPAHSGHLYSSLGANYTDRGNTLLRSEKELVGNLTMELGAISNATRLSLTGGRIIDGINWRATGSTFDREFAPVNSDITFASASVNQRLKLGSFMTLLGGGAYHFQTHEDIETVPYAPEYQFFGGGEIYLYWPDRLLHLYAYSEVVYAGPYEGYDETDLGATPVVNIKLSFKMRSFRFHYVIQNALMAVELPRDYSLGVGRYTYYGFTWDFID